MFKRIDWKSLLLAFITAGLAAVGVRISEGKHIEPSPKSEPTVPEKQVEQPAKNPRDAIGRIAMAGGYCSATTVNPRSPSGVYTLVSAAHCFKSIGEEVTYYPREGASVNAKVEVIDRVADIAILKTSHTDQKLPWVRVASHTPEVGTKVFHSGFGDDKPGNVEVGHVYKKANSQNQVIYWENVSPGDSGGGICHTADGELLSPVCCTENLRGFGKVWGGSPERILQLIKEPVLNLGIPPQAMPGPGKDD